MITDMSVIGKVVFGRVNTLKEKNGWIWAADLTNIDRYTRHLIEDAVLECKNKGLPLEFREIEYLGGEKSWELRVLVEDEQEFKRIIYILKSEIEKLLQGRSYRFRWYNCVEI